MQEKSADCGKNCTFLVESQKSKVESKEGGELDGERKEKGRKKRRVAMLFFLWYMQIFEWEKSLIFFTIA